MGQGGSPIQCDIRHISINQNDMSFLTKSEKAVSACFCRFSDAETSKAERCANTIRPLAIHNAHAVRLFEEHILPHMIEQHGKTLRGKNLGCWCKIGSPCHADSLLKALNP
jgi:hypothetical protein